MAKPNITTRATKGSALTWTEGDANLENLRDATISIKADTAGTSVVSDLNGEITLVAGTNVTLTGDNTAKTITIDAAGGGISNIVEDTTPQLGGTLDANGNEIDMGTNTITDIKVGNWDTAYSWGNHASAGYQSALGFTPENSANKGTANGYASLDANGLVPSTQLPSYVDDVLEYASLATFPTTGETGKIYVAADTSRSYRWTGSVYSEIIASPGTTDNVTEGTTNLYFTTARARSSVSAGTGISYDSATGVITSTVTSGIASVSADIAPMLGGNLDVNGKSIVSISNGNIILSPNGTGIIRADKSLQVQAQGELRLADSDSSNYVGFKSPATVSTNKVWTLPAADGTNGQVLSTNGSGTLSWATASGGGNNIITLMSSDTYGRFTLANTDNTPSTSTFTLASNGGISGVSVSTNTFTLPAGTYYFETGGPVHTSYNNTQRRCSIKLYNNTDGTTTQLWDNFMGVLWGADTYYQWGVLTAYFTIAASKTFQIRTASVPTGGTTTSPVIVYGNESNGEKFMFNITKLA